MKRAKGWRYWLANLGTLGIYPRLVARASQKQRAEAPPSVFNAGDLASLVSALGGMSNIDGLEYSQSRLKVFVKDNQLVVAPSIEKLPFVSGVFITSHAASLLVGPAARDLTKALELYLTAQG